MDKSSRFPTKKFQAIFVLLFAAVLLLGNSRHTLGATAAEVQEWLQAHNTYRALHGVANVTWSDTVAQSAQAWADTCPSSHSGSIYGENMAYATYTPSVGDVVTWWYDEEPLYDYNNPGFSYDTGHFTQVVWKSTTEIGCGHATGCNSFGIYSDVWVCQYKPPGNVIGQFAANVFPPGTPGNGTQEGGMQKGFLPPIYKLLLNK